MLPSHTLTHAEVYAKHLLLKRYGYPLWVPEPYTSINQKVGVQIGDLGYVTPQGAFKTVSNTCSGDSIDSAGRTMIISSDEITSLHDYLPSDCIFASESVESRCSYVLHYVLRFMLSNYFYAEITSRSMAWNTYGHHRTGPYSIYPAVPLQ